MDRHLHHPPLLLATHPSPTLWLFLLHLRGGVTRSVTTADCAATMEAGSSSRLPQEEEHSSGFTLDEDDYPPDYPSDDETDEELGPFNLKTYVLPFRRMGRGGFLAYHPLVGGSGVEVVHREPEQHLSSLNL